MDLIWQDSTPGDPPDFENTTSPYTHYVQSTAPEGTLIDPVKAEDLKKLCDALIANAAPDTSAAAYLQSVAEPLLEGLWAVSADAPANESPGAYDTKSETTDGLEYLSARATPDAPHGAIIGVIDDGIPFAHEQFRIGADSRVASIWIQDAAPAASGPVGQDLPFGRELRGAEISDLLSRFADEDALYRASGAVNLARGPLQRLALGATHGAAVATEAAGFGPDAADTARNLPIIGVSLPASLVQDTLGVLSPLWIGLSALFILHRARRLSHHISQAQGSTVRFPLIVNLSYGLTAGAKDGSSPLAQLLQAIMNLQLPDLGPVRFVMPMGNHRLSRLNATVTPGEEHAIGWEVLPDDRTPSFVEFWGPPRAGTAPPPVPMQLVTRPPGAAASGVTRFGAHGTWQTLTWRGKEIARAYLQSRLTDRGIREVITLVAPPTRPEAPDLPYGHPGLWRIGVHAVDTQPVRIEVQRDETLPGFGSRRGRQSFLRERDPNPGEYDRPGKTRGVLKAGTINALASAPSTIRVGGIFGSTGEVVPYSGLDFPESARSITGDVLAPSDCSFVRRGVLTSGTRSGSWRRYSGTSLSAPGVTRKLAMEFASGVMAPNNNHAEWYRIGTPDPHPRHRC